MGSTHNQDHYKVAGSKMEERGIARRDRRRMSEDNAQLQRKAAAKATPRPATRKASSPAKTKKTKATSAETKVTQKTAEPQSGTRAKTEKSTTRPKTHASSASKKQPKSSKPAAPRAKLVEMRSQRKKASPSATQRIEDLSLAKPWQQAKETADQTGRLVRRLMTLAVDVVTAPLTIIRLARQIRRREGQDATPRSPK